MLYDSGELTVWRGSSEKTAGGMPIERHRKLLEACYGERTVGVNRFYVAKQQGDNPVMLVRIPRTYDISPAADLVTLAPYSRLEPGVFRISQLQQVEDEDGQPATDLSLDRKEGIDAATLESGAGDPDG